MNRSVVLAAACAGCMWTSTYSPIDGATSGGLVGETTTTPVDQLVCADGTGDHEDLQAAIDWALPGDRIGVCPGTYGPIEVPTGADLVIVGLGGPSVTTIDGGSGSAVYVRQATVELSGFTLTGTGVDLDWETDLGGAITTQEATLTVRNCVVSGVTGPHALVFDEEHLLVEDVVWEDNETDFLWFLFQGTNATFRRNTVRGGTHQTVIATDDLTGLLLEHSTFSEITIDRAFTAFSFTGDGEGDLVVANNVFHAVRDLEPWGGRTFDGAADFRNNLVVDCEGGDLERMRASYSLFWNNLLDFEGVVEGEGNVFADPLLADPAAGDFALLPGSPAIDAGDPDPIWNDADGTRNDIGALGGR